MEAKFISSMDSRRYILIKEKAYEFLQQHSSLKNFEKELQRQLVSGEFSSSIERDLYSFTILFPFDREFCQLYLEKGEQAVLEQYQNKYKKAVQMKLAEISVFHLEELIRSGKLNPPGNTESLNLFLDKSYKSKEAKKLEAERLEQNASSSAKEAPVVELVQKDETSASVSSPEDEYIQFKKIAYHYMEDDDFLEEEKLSRFLTILPKSKGGQVLSSLLPPYDDEMCEVYRMLGGDKAQFFQYFLRNASQIPFISKEQYRVVLKYKYDELANHQLDFLISSGQLTPPRRSIKNETPDKKAM